MSLRTLVFLVLALPLSACTPGKEGGLFDDIFGEEEEDPVPEPACTGVRFAAEPVEWALPDFCDERNEDDYPACRFVAENYTDRSGYSTYFSTFDLDGDGALDLVVTRDEESGDDTVGRESWTWHPGEANGFGDAREWALPDFCDERNEDDYPACRFAAENYTDRNGNTTYFSSFDLDGDGVLDMVVTRDEETGEDTTVGRESWTWHPGGANGFGEAREWALPEFCDERNEDDYPACRFAAENYTDRSGNTTYFSTFDITGDGLVDMVVTRDEESGDDTVGREHWLVYKGECGE